MRDYLKSNAILYATVFQRHNAGRPQMLEEYKYTSVEDYVLDRGEVMQSADPRFVTSRVTREEKK